MTKRYFRMSALASRPDRAGMFPVCAKTIRRWVAAGEFPAPVQLGGTKAWDSGVIADFLKKKEAQSA